jgi:Ca2+-binding EF-hand superfamily protein
VAFDFDTSLEEMIDGAESVVAMYPQLVKPSERDNLLASIFKRFDKDEDGLWSLQVRK